MLADDGNEGVYAKRAMRKYLADSGVTEVVRPGRWKYTLIHGQVLVEAVAAGIEPLEFGHRWKKRYVSI